MSVFWHAELDDKSFKLTTFHMPFGRYRWLCWPFGKSSAREVFQRRMHELIEGLDDLEIVADEFVIYDRGQGYHN